jgi:hypothetical protein
MRMTGSRDILGTSGILHCQDRFGNQLRGSRAQDMHAEQAIRPGVGKHFDHTFRFVKTPGPA